jgi:hypothetical protein
MTCQLLGPFAWKLGHDELRAIAEGRRSSQNQGLAQAGKICGIVGTVLLGVSLVFLLFFVGVIVLTAIAEGGADWTRS